MPGFYHGGSMRKDAPEYTNSRMEYIIDEYIHDKVHRDILKSRYLHHITFDKLAEIYQLDDSTIKRIVKKNEWTIFKHP